MSTSHHLVFKGRPQLTVELVHGFTYHKPCKAPNSMSKLHRVSFLVGNKQICGGRHCTCLCEEKVRLLCFRHTFWSYLRGSRETGVASEASELLFLLNQQGLLSVPVFSSSRAQPSVLKRFTSSRASP